MHDIIVRIQISRSEPLTEGSGSKSCLFRQWLTSSLKKHIFSNFFVYYFLKVHLHPSSKIKSQRSHKKGEIKVFLIFLLAAGRIWIREAKKHTGMDHTDPDTNHWCFDNPSRLFRAVELDAQHFILFNHYCSSNVESDFVILKPWLNETLRWE